MATLELNTEKVNLARDILNENDGNFISALAGYYYLVKQNKYPCDFSQEEKQLRINQSLKDYEQGKGINQSELYNRHPEWK